MAARQTLTMAISLEGSAKVETDLSKLGKTAEASFAKIQAAADKAGLSFDKRLGLAIVALRAKLAALGAAGARLGQSFRTFTLSVNTFGNAVANSAKRIGLITAAITGAIGAIVLFARSVANNSERINEQAQSLGVSVEAYQNFQNAAKNAGIEQAAFDAILQRFVVNASDAGEASGDAAKKTDELARSMRQVEITAEDGSKKLITVRGTSEAFAKSLKTVGSSAKGGEKDLIAFAKRVTALGTAQERIAAVIAEGFSKRNAGQVVTFMRALANDADDAARALSKTVGPLKEIEIAVGLNLDAAFDRFRTNLDRTKDRLFLLISPAITIAFEKLADVIFENKDAIEAWAKFIGERAIAIVKDLINVLSGNDAAVENKQIIAFRDGVIAFGQTVKEVIFGIVVPGFRAFIGILDSVAATINSVFGTEFTGKGLAVALVVGQFVGALAILGSTLAVVAASLQLFASGLAFVRVAFGLLAPVITTVVAALAGALGLPVAVVAAIVAAIAAASVAIFVYWDEIVAAANQAWELLKSGAASAFNFLKSTALGAINAIIGFVDKLVAKIKSAISALLSLDEARGDSSVSGGGGGGGGFAQGGSVHGPGSGTADLIPAWLSNGEFVIRAAAVRKWGLGVFQALNGLRMPRGGFRFNMGGLAHAMAPRYASGGPVAAQPAPAGQGRAVTVNFGGESFEMSASEQVVQKLMRAATGKQIRSNGRKPAWFGA